MNFKTWKSKAERRLSLLQMALRLLKEENIYSRIERFEKINFLGDSIKREIDEEKTTA